MSRGSAARRSFSSPGAAELRCNRRAAGSSSHFNGNRHHLAAALATLHPKTRAALRSHRQHLDNAMRFFVVEKRDAPGVVDETVTALDAVTHQRTHSRVATRTVEELVARILPDARDVDDVPGQRFGARPVSG